MTQLANMNQKAATDSHAYLVFQLRKAGFAHHSDVLLTFFKPFKRSQVITEFQGNLADTSGYLYWSLLSNQNGTVFTCIVSHPDTATLLERDVSLGKYAEQRFMFTCYGTSITACKTNLPCQSYRQLSVTSFKSTFCPFFYQ